MPTPTPTALAPRTTCGTCKAEIDLAGRRVGDGLACPSCKAWVVVLRSRVVGDVPPAMEMGGLGPADQREVADALKRIKRRRVGANHAHVELYPSWAVFVAGVQFYLAAILAGQNLIALGEQRRGRTIQLVGVISYLFVGGGLLAATMLFGDKIPPALLGVVAAAIPLGFAVWFTSAQHSLANSAREHGARNASLLLPALVGVMLAIAQAFAVYFLRLRFLGPYVL